MMFLYTAILHHSLYVIDVRHTQSKHGFNIVVLADAIAILLFDPDLARGVECHHLLPFKNAVF